jgi:hypothetical protein
MERSMPQLRDGYPSGGLTESDTTNPGWKRGVFTSAGQNQDGTNNIPIPSSVQSGTNFGTSALNTNRDLFTKFYAGETVDGFVPVEFGQHETFAQYEQFCLKTSRNKGLWAADQELGNRESRRFTRQDDDGTRYGFECPEERDYYPNWVPSPWIDVAVLVSGDKDAMCSYFSANSQNSNSKWYCDISKIPNFTGLAPITQDGCIGVGGIWTEWASWGLPGPDCVYHPISRDNHLGNVLNVDPKTGEPSLATSPEQATYNWKIPDWMEGKTCVLRLRYNMSSSDYPSQLSLTGNNLPASEFFSALHNCDDNGPTSLTDQVVREPAAATITGKPQCEAVITPKGPIFNRPYVYVAPPFGAANRPALSLAMNTDQIGRTFQDRSYVFKVGPWPEQCSKKANLFNLNYRGRRGNIVDCYPSVEYDFVPTRLELRSNYDCVHIQLHGSDFNAQQNPNDGEGWRFSDRQNIVMMRDNDNAENVPALINGDGPLFTQDQAINLAYAGIDFSKVTCGVYIGDENNDNAAQNKYDNCGKLNPAPARFDAGVFKFDAPAGTYHYMSTRANNFSNRSLKGAITIRKFGLSAGAKAGIAIGSIAGVAAIGGLGFFFFKRGGGAGMIKAFSASRAGTSRQ